MSDTRRRSSFVYGLILLVAITATPGYVHAQDRPDATPEHASANAYGTGWQCNRGYQRANGLCTAIALPADAYLTAVSSGRGWDCMRGYRAVGSDCVAILVPANGYLVDEGRGWGWECNRSYAEVGDACVAVQVPENAHLDYAGRAWECDPPYRRELDVCALPQ